MSNRILLSAGLSRLVVLICLTLFFVSLNRPAAAESLEFGSDGVVEGRVADMNQKTRTMGQDFHIGFNGISYEGAVDRAVIEDASPKNLTVKLAVKNISLTIRSIRIDGQRRGAQCGPMRLMLGTEREVWITFQLKRMLEDGETKLVVQDADFELSEDNWQIGSPNWVRPWGFGMTESRVVSGLRSGLASNREAIEWQLGEESADMFAQVEKRLVAHLTNNSPPDKSRLAARESR